MPTTSPYLERVYIVSIWQTRVRICYYAQDVAHVLEILLIADWLIFLCKVCK